MEEIQPGIYSRGSQLYTANADPGETVYGEKLVEEDGREFRGWDPNRSKAAAAVKNGIELEVGRGDEILYLGAASGTTVSHFSDIVSRGFVYAVEYSETVARDLVRLAESRANVAPVVADARQPGKYRKYIEGGVDVVFQDISQRDQAEIFLKNTREYLKSGGLGLLAVKARSVSSSRDPEEIFSEVKEKLEGDMEIIDETRLEPYESDHLFLKLEKKKG